ncbi:M14 family zinc carboxypeptidase [Rhizobacter sp. Root404]|uniref:M14 family zinc carboxypeptidase n=1 Tax=Rhizobacter sp. Root404 TaxID=1736528 RepID=UPI0006F94488|nr:M14 family zinc carboxypeptidase [Rhizobacter sp. Root404]KQW40531.1 zinc carboxypeptidase [Rhizobacter sp. Root404]
MSAAALPELRELDALVDAAGGLLTRRVPAEVVVGHHRLPLTVLTLGNPDRNVPAVGIFGGVHGLERIGTEVVIAFLRALTMRLRWDGGLHRQLESLRLVFMPIVNPGGMLLATRANPNGVDLMRNAPVDARGPVPFMVGGHRRSNRLPWFRGPAGAPMEAESAVLCQVVADELLTRDFSIAIDCHSGFGVRDRLWFPYAHSAEPIACLAEFHALRQILDESQPHHRYIVEPQSAQYLAHGDLWDHLHLQSLRDPSRLFMPLTLEMGSWGWVRKNPRQLFSRHGIFNPLIEHRRERVLRRHMTLLDFAMRAAASHARWRPTGAARAEHEREARRHWFAPPALPGR